MFCFVQGILSSMVLLFMTEFANYLMEHVVRIELTSSDWKSDIITIILYMHITGRSKRNRTSICCFGDNHNSRYTILLHLAEGVGFELTVLTYASFQD